MPLTVVNAQHCPPCNGQCEQGRRCQTTFATTEPGDLAPEREERPARGSGLVVAVLLVLCAACIALALALAISGAKP